MNVDLHLLVRKFAEWKTDTAAQHQLEGLIGQASALMTANDINPRLRGATSKNHFIDLVNDAMADRQGA
jgi:hypothetical protein